MKELYVGDESQHAMTAHRKARLQVAVRGVRGVVRQPLRELERLGPGPAAAAHGLLRVRVAAGGGCAGAAEERVPQQLRRLGGEEGGLVARHGVGVVGLVPVRCDARVAQVAHATQTTQPDQSRLDLESTPIRRRITPRSGLDRSRHDHVHVKDLSTNN